MQAATQNNNQTAPKTIQTFEPVIGELYQITDGNAVSPIFELMCELPIEDGERVFRAKMLLSEDEFDISYTELEECVTAESVS